MTEITDARIDAAIERKATPVGFTTDGTPTVKIDVFQAVQDAHDFALEIRRLRKREEDARGLLEKWNPVSDALKELCHNAFTDTQRSSIRTDDLEALRKSAQALHCALAAWLRGE